jgi:hypothetical protein
MNELSRVFEKDHPKLAELCIQGRNYFDSQSDEEKDLAFKKIVATSYRRKDDLFGVLFVAFLMFKDNAGGRFREAVPFEKRKEKALEILGVEGNDGDEKEMVIRVFLGEYTEKFLAAV